MPPFINGCWLLDFMSYRLVDMRKIRTLNVVDERTRECLAIEVNCSLSGQRVTRVLDWLVAQCGHPKRLLTGSSPEFAGKALADEFTSAAWSIRSLSRVKPTQNAFIESFNGAMRSDCLNEHGFTSATEAKQIPQAWLVGNKEC